MANQVIVTSNNTVQVAIEPTPNVEVTISRTAIGTVANVLNAQTANTVTNNAQPNITTVGTLTSLNVSGTTTTGNLVVTGNLQIGNLTANNANYANYAGNAYSVDLANVNGAGNIASINLDGDSSNVLYGNGVFAPAGTANVANANYANFAGTAYSVSGSNVVGAVANATFATSAGSATTATRAGTVTTNAQPNITSVGTLTSLTVSGNITTSGGRFIGNAAGLTGIPGANVTGTVANATYAANAGYATNAGDAATANIANVAYSVSVSNVSGIGNIATLNLDGNVSNVLRGDGTFAPEGSTGNANYANFAGNAFSVDGANVVGAVANATYAEDAGNAIFASTANIADIANTAYAVDAANVTNLGNIALINLDGNSANLLDGTGNWVAIPTTSANANYANFAGDVVNSAQPNITSLGTLTALDANTSSPINIVTSNGNISFRTINNANTAGRRLEFVYNNPVTYNLAALGADETGFGYYIANTAPGNTSPSNIKSYWQFLNNGNLQHTFGGTGAIVAKQGVFGTGNVSAGNVVATSLYGNIVTPTQSNITQTGNLVSLTVNNGVNGNVFQYNPAGITVGNISYAEVKSSNSGATDAYVLSNITAAPTYTKEWYASNGTNTVPYANIQVATSGNIGAGNVALAGSISLNTYAVDGNLISGDSNLKTGFTVTPQSSFTFFTGAPTAGNLQLFNNFMYGVANSSSATLMRTTRRRGNGTSRLSLEPNDYLGNIEWRGSQANGALPTGSRFAKIAPRVDSSYVANTAAQPVGIEFWVTDNTTARSHTFYANGNVQFNNSVFANGNVQANIVTANYLYGDGSNITGISGSATPAGSNTEIQYNDSGNFGASSAFTFNSSGNILSIASNNLELQGDNRRIQLNGLGEQPPANGVYSSVTVNNGAFSLTQDNIGGGLATFAFTQWEDTNSYLNPYTFFRARGNASSPQPVANGDSVMNQSFFAYGDSGNTYVGLGSFAVNVTSNDLAGNLVTNMGLSTQNNNDGSTINISTDIINLNGNIAEIKNFNDITIATNNNDSSGTLYANTTNMYIGAGANGTFQTTAGIYSFDQVETLEVGTWNETKMSLDDTNKRIFFDVDISNGAPTALLLEATQSSFGGNVDVGGGNINIGANGTVTVSDQISVNSGTILLDGGSGLISATESAIGNTQLSQFQETTFAIGNVSGNISPDFNNGSIQTMTLTGNIVLDSLTNAIAGRSMTLILSQDGSGGHTLSSTMLFAGGSKTLSTAANAIDIISVFYDGSTYYAALSKDYS